MDGLPEARALTPRHVETAPPASSAPSVATAPVAGQQNDPAQQEPPAAETGARRERIATLEREIRNLQQRIRRERNMIQRLALTNEVREKMEELNRLK